jgi:hypothetical protein
MVHDLFTVHHRFYLLLGFYGESAVFRRDLFHSGDMERRRETTLGSTSKRIIQLFLGVLIPESDAQGAVGNPRGRPMDIST